MHIRGSRRIHGLSIRIDTDEWSPQGFLFLIFIHAFGIDIDSVLLHEIKENIPHIDAAKRGDFPYGFPFITLVGAEWNFDHEHVVPVLSHMLVPILPIGWCFDLFPQLGAAASIPPGG